MSGKRVLQFASFVGLVGAAALLVSLSSCAHNQHLVSINVIPGNGTFAAVDPAAFFDYKAYGTYIHPPKTVDITAQATWVSNAPQVANFIAPGVISPNTSCGVTTIYATMYDSPNDIVSNQISITVDGPASEGCPTSTATYTLSVAVNPFTDGSVTSFPVGITCGEGAAPCGSQFATDSSVVLSETPASGHSFLGWSGGGCSGTGTTCVVSMTANVTVTATFN